MLIKQIIRLTFWRKVVIYVLYTHNVGDFNMSAKRKPRRAGPSKVNHRLPTTKKSWLKSVDTSLEICLFAGHLVAVVTLVLEHLL
jgi:hypothetical protein